MADHSAECIDELFFAIGFKYISLQKCRLEIVYAKFLACFTVERCDYILAKVDVSAYSCVPFPRLDVFPFRPFLKIQTPLLIKDVEMDYRMQQSAP